MGAKTIPGGWKLAPIMGWVGQKPAPILGPRDASTSLHGTSGAKPLFKKHFFFFSEGKWGATAPTTSSIPVTHLPLLQLSGQILCLPLSLS